MLELSAWTGLKNKLHGKRAPQVRSISRLHSEGRLATSSRPFTFPASITAVSYGLSRWAYRNPAKFGKNHPNRPCAPGTATSAPTNQVADVGTRRQIRYTGLSVDVVCYLRQPRTLLTNSLHTYNGGGRVQGGRRGTLYGIRWCLRNR